MKLARALFLAATTASLTVAVVACGGGKKKVDTTPVVKDDPPPPPKPETEEDRAEKRLAAAQELVPEGQACMPEALRPSEGAEPSITLELGVVDNKPLVCAIDHAEARLLGPIACWNLDIQTGELSYVAPQPLPGRAYPAKFDGDCVRGYCVPDGGEGTAHIAWTPDGAGVVLLAGTTLHWFDAASKAHSRAIDLAAEELAEGKLVGTPKQLLLAGGQLFVGTAEGGVFAFKDDGTAAGPVTQLGKKPVPVSVVGGSMFAFGDGSIGVSEGALTTLTTLEVATGKRGKLVRKLKNACKPAEFAQLLTGAGDGTPSKKCVDGFAKVFQPFIGTTMVAGKKNHLALLSGPRFGELAVLDAKSLEERRHFPAAWCPTEAPAADGGAGAGADAARDEERKDKDDDGANPCEGGE